MAEILVVGSLNMDIVNQVDAHPLPGETIKSMMTKYCPGGKGANQAAAAQLAGSSVIMIGAVGRDPLGSELVTNLQGFGVNTNYILSKESSSGMAFIAVDRSGENNIIISEGANSLLGVDDLQPILSLPDLQNIDILLLQNEIRWETTRFMIEKAYQRGIKVVYNPAPALSIPDDILAFIHSLILNEVETTYLTGTSVSNQHDARLAAEKLIEQGVQEVVITLGEKGSYYLNHNYQEIFTPSFKVNVVDTTAAGDAFIGAFSVSLQQKMKMEDGLRFATAAAALSVSCHGAQTSLPSSAEINQFLEENAHSPNT